MLCHWTLLNYDENIIHKGKAFEVHNTELFVRFSEKKKRLLTHTIDALQYAFIMKQEKLICITV